MAFRASSRILQDAYSEIKGRAWGVRAAAVAIRAAADTSVTADRILDLAAQIKSAKDFMAQRAALPGIVPFAQTQENDATYNVATEYAAMVTQMDATVAWIANNFPAANGYAQAVTINPDGTTTPRTFDAAQLATFRPVLDALIAAIT